MDNKEAIIQATIKLIEEKGEHLDEVTVREICKRAGVGLGLVNYHFVNKVQLIEQCIERMINGTVEHFQNIREKTDGFTPFEKLTYLGNKPLIFCLNIMPFPKFLFLPICSHRKKMTTLTELMRHIFRLLQPAVLTLMKRR